MSLRLAMGHVDDFDERVARFAQQLGLRSIQMHAPTNLPGNADSYWPFESLRALKEECESYGLLLEGFENIPIEHFERIHYGLDGRDAQIERYIRLIRDLGRLQIPFLGYNFQATFVWRSTFAMRGRGGSLVSAFDLAKVGTESLLKDHRLYPKGLSSDHLTKEALWDNYEYFINAVLPAAEEAGVTLALHPDDPPLDVVLGGAERILTSPEALRKAYEVSGKSKAWGLDFCIGTVSEMGGQPAVERVIDLLGPDGAIAYVHFRDVVGTVPSFREGFLGEGNLNPAQVLRRLQRADFSGFIIDDHVPSMIGDPEPDSASPTEVYCSRGRAHAIGYLQGLLNSLEAG
jgi:mannonate dehydratase